MWDFVSLESLSSFHVFEDLQGTRHPKRGMNSKSFQSQSPLDTSDSSLIIGWPTPLTSLDQNYHCFGDTCDFCLCTQQPAILESMFRKWDWTKQRKSSNWPWRSPWFCSCDVFRSDGGNQYHSLSTNGNLWYFDGTLWHLPFNVPWVAVKISHLLNGHRVTHKAHSRWNASRPPSWTSGV